MKKLDKLILKAFFGPFIVTFFIAFFAFMMQTLWKYIDDLVGKGLDIFTILQFIWYASATLGVLALPIAILISSIMTFGNLGESFELVAVKSAGISLTRFMRPLIIFTGFLCIFSFLFANYVIPYSQLKFVSLYQNILVSKPALDLKEGRFYTAIDRYAIRVGNKDRNGKDLKNVLIYEQMNPLQDNTIIADAGRMEITPDDRFLEFNLKQGTRYQERGNYADTNTEFIRLKFGTLKKLFDISEFQKKQNNDSMLRSNYKMLSAAQLNKNIDSLVLRRDSISKSYIAMIDFSLPYLKDSTPSGINRDSVRYTKNEKLFPDSLRDLLYERAISKAAELKNTLVFSGFESFGTREQIRKHKMEWHRKFSFSLACLVLFFIGAPLGSIIRKGGLGMPLIVAIVFFLLFHLLNMFGEKFVKNLLLPPVAGMWLAVMILAPVGMFFTYKAMHDSQLFKKETYLDVLRKLRLVKRSA